MVEFIQSITKRLLSAGQISSDEAIQLLSVNEKELYYLFANANLIRLHFRGRGVDLCAITNAKSGLCSEDCLFCSQSVHYRTGVTAYPLISIEEMVNRADRARMRKANRFCIVISGRGVKNEELDKICEALSLIKQRFPTLRRDASLGELTKDTAYQLKEAGLERYNHNLETSEDFFPQICKTHSFVDRLKTIEILKEVGLEVCCGGIFGLGESSEQRIEFAFELKALDVDCIPINFLNPIPGTPLESNPPIPPSELLKTVAIFRYILPNKQIRICGGREKNLRSLQSMIFLAGADSMIIGDYLTTKGALAEEDLQMIADLGLDV